MTEQDMLTRIADLVEETRVAVLATADEDGRPHLRWMTPMVLKRWPGVLFAVTGPDFPKVAQLDRQPDVEWMLQTRALDQVINVRGRLAVIDNPSLRAELLEEMGQRLTVFWKVQNESTELVVLETRIDEAAWYRPMQDRREVVTFTQQAEGKQEASDD